MADALARGAASNDHGFPDLFVHDRGAAASLCRDLVPTVVAAPRQLRLRGTPGDDVILGNALANQIHGGGGNDVICGEGGNDRLYGGNGDDRIDGGEGQDLIDGGPDRDVCVNGERVLRCGPASG